MALPFCFVVYMHHEEIYHQNNKEWLVLEGFVICLCLPSDRATNTFLAERY